MAEDGGSDEAEDGGEQCRIELIKCSMSRAKSTRI